jgi:hypothetical protein
VSVKLRISAVDGPYCPVPQTHRYFPEYALVGIPTDTGIDLVLVPTVPPFKCRLPVGDNWKAFYGSCGQ